MKYKSFKITNYKGIKNLEVAFDKGKILTILGLNECGKTTLLEAIKNWGVLAKGGELRNGKKSAILPKGYDVFWCGEITLSAKLDISSSKEVIKKKFEIKDFQEEIEITFFYKVSKDCIAEKHDIRTNLKLARGQSTDFENKIVEFICQTSPSIIYHEDFCFDVPNEIVFFKDLITQLPDEESIKRNTMWQKILDDSLKGFSNKSEVTFQKDIIPELYKPDNSNIFKSTISKLSKYIDKNISDPWAQKVKLLKNITFKEITLDHNILDDKVIFSFKIVAEDGSIFFINERSKGCRWFFSFILFTTFRQHRESNVLFLLDEPASNLHASVQEQVTQSLIQLSDKNYIIYTTHSPYMLDELHFDTTFLMMNNQKDELSAKPEISLVPAKQCIYGAKNKDFHIRPIFDFLSFTVPKHYPKNNSLLIEGITDFRHFQFFDLIMREQSCKKVSFTACYGATSMKPIIFTLQRDKFNFAILLDSDQAGVDAKYQYIEQCGVLENQVFTYKDCDIDSISDIESFYTDEDRNHLIELACLPDNYEMKQKDKLYKAITEIQKKAMLDNEVLDEIKLSDCAKERIATFYKKLSEKLNFA